MSPMTDPLSMSNGNPAPEPTISPYATETLKKILFKLLPEYAHHLVQDVSIVKKSYDTVEVEAPPLVIDFAEHDDAVAKFFFPKVAVWRKSQPIFEGLPDPQSDKPDKCYESVLQYMRDIELRCIRSETRLMKLEDGYGGNAPSPSPGNPDRISELEALNADQAHELQKLRYDNDQMRNALSMAYDAIRYYL